MSNMTTAKNVAIVAGKKIKETYSISGDGTDFDIDNNVIRKVIELDLSIGTTCGDMPRGLAKNSSIAKWKNIDESEYKLLDGVVVCDNFRNGTEAWLVLFE